MWNVHVEGRLSRFGTVNRGLVEVEMYGNQFSRVCLGVLALLSFVVVAYAHVTVAPAESSVGKNENYVMRVPNERDSPTVRVEVEFPLDANIGYFEQKA